MLDVEELVILSDELVSVSSCKICDSLVGSFVGLIVHC